MKTSVNLAGVGTEESGYDGIWYVWLWRGVQ